MSARLSDKSNALLLLFGLMIVLASFYSQTVEAACPDTAITGSPVEYVGCAEAFVVDPGITQTITIATPNPTGGAQVGDLMVAAVAIDEAHVVTGVPAGWTILHFDNAGGANGAASLSVMTKFVELSDIGSTNTFVDSIVGTGTGTDPLEAEHYGWIMMFRNVSGIVDSDIIPNGGASDLPDTPSVTTLSVDNLILRIVGYDGDHDGVFTQDQAGLIAGYTTITLEQSSGDNGDAATGYAGYANQAGTGASGIETLPDIGNNERWVGVTLALEPPPDHFRISHLGAGDTCTPIDINIRASDSAGNTITTYTGTIDLSTDTGEGSWAIGSGNGTLVNGPNDGTATYTFDAADAGIATLSFLHINPDADINFDVADGSIVEDPGFDQELAITSCTPPVFAAGAAVCADIGTGTLNLTITDNSVNSNRAVIVVAGSEGNATPTTDAEVNNVNMQVVASALTGPGGFDNQAEIWVMLNATLPSAGGTYAVDYTGSLPSAGYFCAWELTDVEQVIPAGNGAGLPVNITATEAGGASVTTNITPTQDNAYAASVVTTGGQVNSTGSSLPDLITEYDIGGSNFTLISHTGTIPTAVLTGVTENFDGTPAPARIAHVASAFNPITTTATEIRITHNFSGALCSANTVTFGIYDDYGQLVTDYAGTIDITTSNNDGNWSDVSGTNLVVDGGGDGSASYTFDPADGGEVVLAYSHDIAETVNFDADDGTLFTSPFFDGDLTLGDCFFRISLDDAVSGTCSEEGVTIEAVDNAGNTLTAFTGTVQLSTSTNNGTWSIGTGSGTLTETIVGDGTATYTFTLADAGSVTLGFNDQTQETVNFDATDGVYGVESGYDPDLTVGACNFGITHSGTGQTCSVTSVTFGVYDTGGTQGIYYSGTMTISTNTGQGTWVNPSGAGFFSNDGNGDATYEFDPSDNAVVTIDLNVPATGPVNIDVTDGVINEDPGFDADITFSVCEFRISHGGTTDTCTPISITMAAFDSGGNPGIYYSGTVTLSTDTGNGYWAAGTGTGAFTPGPGNGMAEYFFAPADNGSVAFSFYDEVPETVNFNITDGSAVVNGSFDPDLTVSSCVLSPGVSTEVCSSDAGPADEADLTIVGDATNSDRIVVLIAGSEGNVTPPAAAATFDGVSMSLVARALTPGQGGGTWGNMVDIFAILDGPLPNAAGTYTASYSAGLENNSEFCVLEITDAEQVIPASGAGQPANTTVTTGGGNFVTTNITTTADNAVAFSGVSTGGVIDSTGSTLANLWEFDFGGGGTTFIGSSGTIASAGATAITENFSATPAPARIAHNVVSFAPAPLGVSQFSISHNNTGGTCSVNLITISALDIAGQVVTGYTGTISLDTTSGEGEWTVVSGTNAIVDVDTNDGQADYTFDAADNGVVVLGFFQTTPGTVNFDVTDGTYNETPFFDNDLVLGDCAFQISNVGNAYTCTAEAITITAVDGGGNPLTGYQGTLTLTTSTGNGSWDIGSGNGVLTDLGGGSATYTFSLADAGSVTLGFTDTVLETVNINVDDGTYTEDGAFDPNINVLGCEYRISHSGTGDTCTPESVTIEVVDGDGNPALGFTGSINLFTSTFNGTWSLNTGSGTLNDPSSDDGQASYAFDATDNGVVVLDFTDIHEELVNFNVNGSGYTVNPGFDPDLNVVGCAFQISHSGSGDQCTVEAVTITAVDGTGATLTSFTGTVNLTTDTTNGTWSLNTGAGTFNDPIAGDGAASYTFVAGDNGVAVLDFNDSFAETVNIDVTNGAINEDPLFDPDMTIDLCTFRISAAAGTLSACGFDTITIDVYDSGGAPATNYTGLVDISTDTANGNWVSTTGAGVLTDTNPNDGIASYAFDASDGGSVSFQFSDETVETVNIDLDANGLIEDPGFDPDIDVTACFPTILDQQCYTNQSQASAITINSSAATGGSRMVLMYTSTESLVPAVTATIDVNVMTELKNETANFGIGHVLQVYGILDADLPSGAGTFDAAFTGSANGPAMCLVSLEGVKQTFPADNGDETGQLNGSNAANTALASTSITTINNNSLVLSVVANGQGGTTYTSTLGNSMWITGVADATSSDWAGNQDVQPTTGLLQVDETASTDPNRHAHIVLALAPIVAGNPFAADYVPVTLFQTISGNVNYRATGFTLRDQPNSVDSCSFVPTATGSTADMVIPASSTITASYLYWAGSGSEAQEDNVVTFGVDGSPGTVVTADDMYHVVTAYGIAGMDFFAGYKDVTGLISTNPTTTYRLSDLTVQTGAPWNTVQGCLGGWGLVVVYENILENLNIINLFQGFQPFRFSSFQLVPRNFRMATPDGVNIPNGQLTHLTFEGDDSLNEPGELLELQNDPLNLTFTPLTNSVNTAIASGAANDAQYNDTVTHPAYDGNLDFDPTGGDDGMGYFIDSLISYGTDVDTFYIQGANPGEILYPFGSSAAEQITTRYGSGQDGVLLVGEFISVTNAPIADLEVFINESGTFKVDSAGTGMYSYTVTNNGNGAVSGGFADGDVVLTINLPVGMTAASITAPSWTCTPDVVIPDATAFTCIFDIAADWNIGLGAATNAELAAGETLPAIDVTVNVAGSGTYPLLENPVTQSARIAHFSDYANSGPYPSCVEAVIGVQPDPTQCPKADQFDNVNDLNKNTIDIDDLDEKSANNNNVVQQLTTVEGIETDLSITKAVVGVLEENQPAQYQLTVTNNGPDVTTLTMTVTDTLPDGLVPNTAGGTGWTCNILGQNVSCTRTTPLAVSASSIITINTVSVVSPAVEGAFVSNTAVVQAGTYNFDQVPGNNSDTDITEVVGEPVASNEKFLITVNETSTIGGAGAFRGWRSGALRPGTGHCHHVPGRKQYSRTNQFEQYRCPAPVTQRAYSHVHGHRRQSDCRSDL